jgi:hypothetical protein
MIKHSTSHKQITKTLLTMFILLVLISFSSIKSLHASTLFEPTKPKVTTSVSNDFILHKNLSDALVETPLTLVGSAQFSVLFWDIYNSRLHTSSGKYSPTSSFNKTGATDRKSPLLFEIEYLRDITKQDLISRTVEQWEHLAIEPTIYVDFIPLLEAIWPNIKAGDSLALWVDGTTSHFYFNGAHIGTVSQDNFGQLFTAIWLAPNTSQPKLRDKLIGENK